jgi:hypothetical protein
MRISRRRRRVLLVVLVLGTGALLLRHYSRLPSLEGRTVSTAVTDTRDTQLGRAIAPLVASLVAALIGTSILLRRKPDIALAADELGSTPCFIGRASLAFARAKVSWPHLSTLTTYLV